MGRTLKRLAAIENYVACLKETREKRRKTTPELPRTAFENEAKGYLNALDTVIADLERILED